MNAIKYLLTLLLGGAYITGLTLGICFGLFLFGWFVKWLWCELGPSLLLAYSVFVVAGIAAWEHWRGVADQQDDEEYL